MNKELKFQRTQEFIPTRRSLLTRLKQWDDQQSWRIFFDTYWKLIYSVALKAGMSDVEAQEVVQETIISVAKKMPGFRYDPQIGSFKSWLLQLTRRRIVDQFRKRPRELPLSEPDGTTRTAAVARIPDPAGPGLERLWEEEWRRNLLQTALERVKHQVKPGQYQLFELYALKDWPMSRITTALGVTPSQVYLAKHRLGKLIKHQLQLIESELL